MIDENRSPVHTDNTGSDLGERPRNGARRTLLYSRSHPPDGGTEVWDPDALATGYHLFILMLFLLPVLTIGDLLLNHWIPGSVASNVKLVICAVIGNLTAMFLTMPRYVVTDERGLAVKSCLGKTRRLEWLDIRGLHRPRVAWRRVHLTISARERVRVSLFGHPRDQRERLFDLMVFMAGLTPCPNDPRKFIREHPDPVPLPGPPRR